MKILSRAVFREILSSALLGTVLFTFVLFLQRVGTAKLFEILVRSSAPPGTVAYLFALVLPFTLTFTLPVGVLVGVLIGLSRMSSDGEITGMRAAGVPSRKVVAPILAFASIGAAGAACCSLWLTPLSIRESYRVLNRLMAAQLTAEIQPRVFEEQFPNTILYVADVVPGPVVRWRRVFVADLRPASERSTGGRERGDSPRVTLAREAIAVADQARNRIQLSMRDGSTHEVGKEPSEYYNTTFPSGDQVLRASPPGEVRARPYVEMDTGPLWREARSSIDARIELHQRLALPLACVLLALVGIPLGISSRKSGKSAAFVLTVALALLYFTGLISLINLARNGTLPVGPAVWTMNVVFAAVGILLLVRLENPGDRDVVGRVKSRFQGLWARFRRRLGVPQGAFNGGRLGRLPLLPQIVDTYVLSTFLFYFALLLASFVLVTQVFTFFELLSEIVKNKVPMPRVLAYLFFLTPQLIYLSTPVSVLVAVLVTFGVMTKHNEVTAFKATGVSLHRLAVPVLLAASILSVGLFAFDHYYVPGANRKQEALRSEIKNRPVQTYLRPDRKWIFGNGPRIYYYKFFDPNWGGVLGGVSVYELDMEAFRLRRHISAERARWEPSRRSWVFENGWTRDFRGSGDTNYRSFETETFRELDEPPAYFMKEAPQDKQMNFRQLEEYIRELQQSGFDTVRLQVQLQKKFSVPVFALIMALISTPFAFLTGNRGAMAGVGVSFGIAIAYWLVNQVFEQVGNLNQLPPMLAAWSPGAIFCLAGIYLMARMRT
jgi:LPS export ABC transporter permease LptG/LPS export ABC transporter permease LptF